MSYNIYYNRRNAFVHFHPHCEVRIATRNIEVDKIVETVHSGQVLGAKSKLPNKVAFKRFFKEGHTYIVITERWPNSFQVKTVWRKNGRI